MSGYTLRHFSKDEITITPADARLILRFFFPGQNVPPQDQLTIEDQGFAQALLLEAIDSSYAMSYVQDIFDAFCGTLPVEFSGLKDMVRDFVKRAARTWFDHASGKDLSNPRIYGSVRAAIRTNFQDVWRVRLATGNLDY